MRAFTLLEILIVVVILAILAVIAAPHFADASRDADSAALRTTLANVHKRIGYEYQAASPPAFPAAIDSAWFAVGAGLQHPENSFGVPDVETVNDPGTLHPADKILQAGVAGAFWYNSAEGIIRARVASQGNSTATLNYYNEVNASNESSLGGGGGGNPWGS
jgi:prepilin-type N-terminal cleavage/methylation domain-containing protein